MIHSVKKNNIRGNWGDVYKISNSSINKNTVTGEWRDVFHYTDGRVTEGAWQHNIIVDTINILIAALMKNHSGFKGVTYWAVGEGESTWDPVNPNVTMDATRKKLYKEIARKAVDTISFIDLDNNVITTPTNRILVTCTFNPSEALGIWREFALFGGNATVALDSGYMLDHKVHQMYIKTSDVTVERQIRFIFE